MNISKSLRHGFDVVANPFYRDLPLKSKFSLKYGLHQPLDLTSKAEKVKDPHLKTIAKVVANFIDLVGALFYLPLAFLFNWTLGSLNNRIIHIQNKEIKRENKNLRIKNPIPVCIALVAAGIFAAYHYGFFDSVKQSAPYALFRSWLSDKGIL